MVRVHDHINVDIEIGSVFLAAVAATEDVNSDTPKVVHHHRLLFLECLLDKMGCQLLIVEVVRIGILIIYLSFYLQLVIHLVNHESE
jgi:hypothetical protein